MRTPIVILCLLASCQLFSQDLVQFHSEEMKQLFIKAGADLDGDGEVQVAEANVVESLSFGIQSYYNVPHIDLNLWLFAHGGPNWVRHPAFYPCQTYDPDGIPSYDDCNGCGGSHNNDSPEYDFEINFQGIEHFSILKHLGIQTGKPFHELSIPSSLETLHMYDAHDAPLVIPENSELQYFVYDGGLNSGIVDLSNCSKLKKISLKSGNSGMILPGLSGLESLESGIDLNFGGQSLENLEDLGLTNFSANIDISSLSKLRRLKLDKVSGEPVSIENETVEHISISDCSAELSIAHCHKLDNLTIENSRVVYIGHNPILDQIPVRVGVGGIEIEDNPQVRFIYFTGDGQFDGSIGSVEDITIRNMTGLEHIKMLSEFTGEVVIGNTPALKYLELHNLAEMVGFEIDSENQVALEYLNLIGFSTDALYLDHQTAFQNLNLEKGELHLLELDGSQVGKVYINSVTEFDAVIGEDFNPKQLHIENCISPDFDFSSFTNIERMAIINSNFNDVLHFEECNSLERLFIKDTNASEIKLCNDSPDMGLRVHGRSEDSQVIRVDLATNSINQMIDLCAWELELELYDCNGSQFGTVTEISVDVETLRQTDLSLSPNPTSDFIYWYQNDTSATTQIEVYNLSGQQVLKEDATNSKLFLGDLNPGIYLVNFLTEKGTVSERVLVQ